MGIDGRGPLVPKVPCPLIGTEEGHLGKYRVEEISSILVEQCMYVLILICLVSIIIIIITSINIIVITIIISHHILKIYHCFRKRVRVLM